MAASHLTAERLGDRVGSGAGGQVVWKAGGGVGVRVADVGAMLKPHQDSL